VGKEEHLIDNDCEIINTNVNEAIILVDLTREATHISLQQGRLDLKNSLAGTTER